MSTIEFVNYGHRYRLSREEVEAAVAPLQPDVIQSLAVYINGKWWPVKQPFVQTLRPKGGNIRDNSHVNSRTALRHLERLGFPTHDTETQGPLPESPTGVAVAAPNVELRRFALTLAVELRKASSAGPSDVLDVAESFVVWLG